MIATLSRTWGQIKKSYFLSPEQKTLKQLVEAKYPPFPKKKNAKLVLVQCIEDYYYWGIFLSIITSLRANQEINVEQYIVRSLRPFSSSSIKQLIHSLLFVNYMSDAKWVSLYRAFCNQVAFCTTGFFKMMADTALFLQAYKIWRNLSSKQQLVLLEIDNVVVGDLINDSYLRFKPSPTVDLNDWYLFIVTWQALRTIKHSKRYFSVKQPDLYLTSYATYIQHGIPVRVALNMGVPVYSFGNFQEFAKKLEINDYMHPGNADRYRLDFDQLLGQEEKLRQAQEKLSYRLSGGVDSATSYMAKSAYSSEKNTDVPDVNGAVVIFLHDFYDSPHGYRWMLFPDFYEWVCFTVEVLTELGIPFFIKPHPNQINLSSGVIGEIKQRYPNLRWIPAAVPNTGLVSGGMKCAITVHGTVSHELAFLGVPSIVCGDNPHVSFDFCRIARTQVEYRALLGQSLEIPLDQPQLQLQSLMFYYMHNLNKSEAETCLLDAVQQFRKLTYVDTLNYEHVAQIISSIDRLVHCENEAANSLPKIATQHQ